MKTIVNKTHRPIQVPLPGGKVLHLGPAKTGQVAANALDHAPFARLVEDGTLALQGEGGPPPVEHGDGPAAHESTHGHHPPTSTRARGDR